MSLRPVHQPIPVEHPTSDTLFDFAEHIAAGRALPPGDAARHVESCNPCREEIELARRSILAVSAVAELTPSRSRTAGLLLAARNERRVVQARMVRRRRVVRVSKGFSVAAAAVVTVQLAYNYGIAPNTPQSSRLDKPEISLNATPLKTLRPIAAAVVDQPFGEPPSVTWNNDGATEDLLRAAIVSQPAGLRSAHQERTLRKMKMLDADLDAAMKALEHNPALARAKTIVMTNSRQVTEELWDWYVKRPL